MSDKAERLHTLIGKMREASIEVKIRQPGHTTNANQASSLPLWQAFGPIAAALGYPDYGDFREAFTDLCQSIRRDVRTMVIQKESVRDSWVNCIDVVARVFDANNFGTATSDVFNTYFSARNLEVLDSISERFQAIGLEESSTSELEEALSAVREAIAAFQRAGKLDARVASVLSHYLQQMEMVFAHVNDFGDETFWRVYKETFATFVQLHPVIADLDNAEEIRGKLRIVADKLTSKSIAGISLAANLATIGSLFLPLLK